MNEDDEDEEEEKVFLQENSILQAFIPRLCTNLYEFNFLKDSN